MDTDKLRYFCTIAETGSLTKASQILNISHSGLSKAIAALETETRLKLFKPLGRGLEITPDGRWFYQKAQEILQIANEISKGQQTPPRVLRVGLSGVISVTCASILSKEFEEAMTFLESELGVIEGRIISGEVDFGIGFIPSPKPELEYLELGEVRFNSYAREDLLKKMESSEIPYVVPTSELPFNPLGVRTRDGWPEAVARSPHFSANHFSIALDLLRSGQSAAYIPDYIAERENEFSRLKILKVKGHAKAETKKKIYLIKNQSAAESKEMKKAAKVIRKICF